MHTGRRLTVAVAAAALSFSTALAVAVPAGAAPGSTDPGQRSDASRQERQLQVLTPPQLAPRPVASSGRGALAQSDRAARRPLFAFWGKKYNSIDGFSFRTAKRGSGTSVQVGIAWKTYRGVTPIKPKVFAQARVDGGKWRKVKGAKGKIGRQYVTARMPAFTVAAGVATQTVDYRLKTKKLKKGPRRARRSVTSDKVTVTYDNQSMYSGAQAYYYNTVSALCPTARIELDRTNITEEHDAVYDWQYGITMDDVALALQNNDAVETNAIMAHECAHQRQFYNWGGTLKGRTAMESRSAAVFTADNNPDPNVVTPPMQEGWKPLEHAADCAALNVYPTNVRTYGGYCNPTELAAAALLYQGLQY